tara:strand:- start:3726 stop:3965 length:240 start_codon:yes stop_codon:yes gene_type:complete
LERRLQAAELPKARARKRTTQDLNAAAAEPSADEARGVTRPRLRADGAQDGAAGEVGAEEEDEEDEAEAGTKTDKGNDG